MGYEWVRVMPCLEVSWGGRLMLSCYRFSRVEKGVGVVMDGVSGRGSKEGKERGWGGVVKGDGCEEETDGGGGKGVRAARRY